MQKRFLRQVLLHITILLLLFIPHNIVIISIIIDGSILLLYCLAIYFFVRNIWFYDDQYENMMEEANKIFEKDLFGANFLTRHVEYFIIIMVVPIFLLLIVGYADRLGEIGIAHNTMNGSFLMFGTTILMEILFIPLVIIVVQLGYLIRKRMELVYIFAGLVIIQLVFTTFKILDRHLSARIMITFSVLWGFLLFYVPLYLEYVAFIEMKRIQKKRSFTKK